MKTLTTALGAVLLMLSVPFGVYNLSYVASYLVISIAVTLIWLGNRDEVTFWQVLLSVLGVGLAAVAAVSELNKNPYSEIVGWVALSMFSLFLGCTYILMKWKWAAVAWVTVWLFATCWHRDFLFLALLPACVYIGGMICEACSNEEAREAQRPKEEAIPET